jgi:hypothetical protein
MTGDMVTPESGEVPAASNDDVPAAQKLMAEIELGLANIMTAVRDVAIAAEELLRDISLPDGAARAPRPAYATVNCAPFVVEASRVQINALHAMISRRQLAA